MCLVFFYLCVLPVHGQWQSEYYRDHALVGKIYQVEKQQWIDQDSLTEIVLKHNLILLGETHSNPDHHILQAQIIKTLVDAGSAPKIVMEMLEYDERLVNESSHEALSQALQASSPRWDWPLYEPITHIVQRKQLPLWGGNLDDATLDTIRQQKSCQFSLAGKTMNICQALPTPAVELIKQLIYASHCEYMPLQHTQGMANAQIAKDMAFTNKLVSAGLHDKAVLIAGSVHVRKDIGVPVHLESLGLSALSIGYISVHPDFELASDYTSGDNARSFDVLVFTPSDRNQDPCEEFARQLEQMKQQHQ
jgi:uncharacterized iron-regulated protein